MDNDPRIHRGLPLTGDVLSQLWTLLRDQYPLTGASPYSTITVLKELLQNSDDAPGSKVVRFGWMPGLKEASHPLLRDCPIFFYVNDGHFTGENAFAIAKLGISESAGQVDRIGRFGMGLKSIFHLGEVFFWLAREIEAPEFLGTRFRREELVTPWQDSKYHLDWNDIQEADFEALRARLSSVVGGLDNFLAFVVPLRRPEAVPSPNLTSEGFRGTDIVDSRIAPPIARMLPNLRHIEQVSALHLDESGAPTPIFTIGVVPSTWPARMVGPESLTPESSSVQWSGRTECSATAESHTDSKATGSLLYAGIERGISGQQDLTKLRGASNWPQKRNSKGDWCPIELSGHCALTLTFGADHLSWSDVGLRWAVYLPLGNEADHLSKKATLCLHGHFFVDAGRHAVVWWDHTADVDAPALHTENLSEEAIRKEWNRLLCEKGALPLLPQLLANVAGMLATNKRDSAAFLEELTRGIDRSIAKDAKLEPLRAAITEKRQWLCRLGADESVRRWVAVSGDQSFWVLPKPAGRDEGLPYRALPGLRAFAESEIVTRMDWPRFSNNSALWDERALAQLLTDTAEIREVEALEYFCDFLVAVGKETGTAPIQTLLRRTIPASISEIATREKEGGEAANDRLLAALIKLIEFVPQDQCCAIGNLDTLRSNPALRAIFSEVASEFLPLPNDLDRQKRASLKLSPKRFLTFASWIMGNGAAAPTHRAAALVALFDACADKDAVRSHVDFRALRFVPGTLRDSSGRRDILLSLNDIESEVSRLVVNLDRDSERFVESFLRCTVGVRLVEVMLPPRAGIISSFLDSAVRRARSIITVCCQALSASANSQVVGIDSRREVIRRVHEESVREGRVEDEPNRAIILRNAMRFLLSGTRQANDEPGVSLLVPDENLEEVWITVLAASRACNDDKWRLVGRDLADTIARQYWANYGLERQDKPKALQELESGGPELVKKMNLDPHARNTLARALSDEPDRQDLLRRLPLHENSEGDFKAIDGNSRLAGELEHRAPAAWLKHFQFFRNEQQPWLGGRLGLRRLDYDDLLKGFLDHAPESATSAELSDQHRILLAEVLIEMLRDETSVNKLTTGQRGLLAETRWLPVRDSNPRQWISPSKLIPSDELEISEALRDARERGVCTLFTSREVDRSAIDAQQTEMAAIGREFCAAYPEDHVQAIANALSEQPKYGLGRFTEECRLEQMIDILGRLPLAGLRAARECARIYGGAITELELLPLLHRSEPAPEIVCVILSTLWRILSTPETRDGTDLSTVQSLFRGYLKGTNDLDDEWFRRVASELSFPTREGRWLPPAELFRPEAARESRITVADEYANILCRRPRATDEVEAGFEPTAPRGRVFTNVQDFLQEFQGAGTPGYLLAILGYLLTKRVDVARVFSEHHTSEATKEWLTSLRRISLDVEQAKPPEKWAQLILIDGDHETDETHRNLLGIPVAQAIESFVQTCDLEQCSLLLYSPGAFPHKTIEHLQRMMAEAICRVAGLLIPGRQVADLREGLLDYAEVIAQETVSASRREIIFGELPALASTLSKLDAQSAADIQSLIVEHAEATRVALSKLNTPGGPFQKLVVWQGQMRDQDRRELEHEFRTTNFGETIRALNEAIGEQRLKKLESICKRVEVQQGLLDATRSRVKAYEYGPRNVLFELFQNADDSVAQLEKLGVPTGSVAFDVLVEDDCIFVCHWGRHINEYKSRGHDQTTLGFHRDLVLMLSFGKSHKAPEGGELTGKFGLGFKSVLFLTNEPTIISGRTLTCRIKGGVLPWEFDRNTEALEEAELQSRLQESRLQLCGPAAIREGTIIRLRRAPDRNEDFKTAVEWFAQLFVWLPLFAQRIRTIRLRVAGKMLRAQTTQWTSDFRFECIGLDRTQHLATDGHDDRAATEVDDVLILRERTRTWAIPVDRSRGFVPLQRGVQPIPRLWSTTPLFDETDGVDFVMNSSGFRVDAGRSRLGNWQRDPNTHVDPPNWEESRALGNVFRVAFETILGQAGTVAEAFEPVRGLLHLDSRVTAEQFWSGAWKMFAQDVANSLNTVSGAVAHKALWESVGGGYRWVCEHFDVIPNGLQNDRTLTRLGALRYKLSGLLASDALVNQLKHWPLFSAEFNPRQVVSAQVFATIACLIGEDAPTLRDLTLTRVLRWELKAAAAETTSSWRRINPSLATLLAAVVNPASVEEWRKDGAAETDFMALKTVLGSIFFQAADGQWRAANDLLLRTSDGATTYGESGLHEEAQLVAFAPDDHLVAPNYTDQGQKFIRACRCAFSRRRPEPNDLRIADWAVRSMDLQRRQGVLRYLLSESFRHRDLVEALKRAAQEPDCWLSKLRNLNNQAFPANFTPQERLQVLVILGLVIPPETREEKPRPPEHEVMSFFHDVEAWWSNDSIRGGLIRRYLQDQYPAGFELSLARTERRTWMVLFIRAMGYTMGWFRDFQHKGFIELCDERKWLDVFAMIPPAESDSDEWNRRWIGVLDEIADEGRQEVRYLHWMKLLPLVYRIARNLDEYTELFCGLDAGSPTDLISLDSIVTPAIDPELESGTTAPSLRQAVGLGIFFILRELVRTGTIRGDRIQQHCFVPSPTIRKGFSNLGCDIDSDANHFARLNWSEQIVIFLKSRGVKDFTFERNFDIPFIILSRLGWIADHDSEGQRLATFWRTRAF